MEIVLYQPNYNLDEAIDEFVDSFHYSKMKNLASGLLSEDYTPEEIAAAIRKGIKVCQSAGVNPRHHFHPVYTQHEGIVVKDCKLSDFGYALVMLNGPANRNTTAALQVKLLNDLLNE